MKVKIHVWVDAQRHRIKRDFNSHSLKVPAEHANRIVDELFDFGRFLAGRGQPTRNDERGLRKGIRLAAPRRAPLAEFVRRYGLTRRESEVLSWVVEGKTNRETAIILGLSARTVQIHLKNVYRKLGVETRTAAAALVLRGSLGAASAYAMTLE